MLLTRRASLFVAAFFALAPIGAAQAQTADFGVLVMAHGGGSAWNSEVETMLAPVARDYPLEIAFGMAEPASLQTAVQRLEARGVRRIVVIRLFISGDSWRERTEQILGLRPGAPPQPHQSTHAAQTAHGGHNMDLWRVNTIASFALSAEGLADASEMGAVLVERAHALSDDPRHESVLILAHGPEDDAENERWLARIGMRAEAISQAAPYRAVRVETLREDWPEKRVASEARIRAFVQEAAANGGRAIVIPYRVSGFGPYARVLDGLVYEADGRGLIPSAEVEHWVRRQIAEMREGEFRTPAPAEDARHEHHPG